MGTRAFIFGDLNKGIKILKLWEQGDKDNLGMVPGDAFECVYLLYFRDLCGGGGGGTLAYEHSSVKQSEEA